MGLSNYSTIILLVGTAGLTYCAAKFASSSVEEAIDRPLTKPTIIFWVVVITLIQLIIIKVAFTPVSYIIGLLIIAGMQVLTIRPPKDEVWENPLLRWGSWMVLSLIPTISLFMLTGERKDGWNAGTLANVLLYIILPLLVELIVGGALLVYCFSKKPRKEDQASDATPASAT